MTPEEKRRYSRSFPVCVGVDMGKKTHVFVGEYSGGAGGRTKPVTVRVSRKGFEDADEAMAKLFPGIPTSQILVGLEFAGHHGFTYAHHLSQKGYPVVNVLPAHTKSSKEHEGNSPLKSDAKDAVTIVRLTSDGVFVRFPFLESPYVELRLLTAHRHRLTVEAARYKNRLQGLLDLAWPEFMEHFSWIEGVTARTVLERWPLPKDLLASSPATVHKAFQKSSRGHLVGEKVSNFLEATRHTIALPYAAEERRMEITCLIERWKLVREQRKAVEEAIGKHVEACRPAQLLMTLPSVSAVCAATILSELGTPEDFESHRQILKMAGMNLISASSGLQTPQMVRKWQSKRGRPALRQQLFLLAGRWCQENGLYHKSYQRMLERNGTRRTMAVASQARKLVRVIFELLRTGQPFDANKWGRDHRWRHPD